MIYEWIGDEYRLPLATFLSSADATRGPPVRPSTFASRGMQIGRIPGNAGAGRYYGFLNAAGS